MHVQKSHAQCVSCTTAGVTFMSWWCGLNCMLGSSITNTERSEWATILNWAFRLVAHPGRSVLAVDELSWLAGLCRSLHYCHAPEHCHVDSVYYTGSTTKTKGYESVCSSQTHGISLLHGSLVGKPVSNRTASDVLSALDCPTLHCWSVAHQTNNWASLT